MNSPFRLIEPGDRVVVTGAAGFIGSAVTRALLNRGAVVVAVIEPGGVNSNLDGLPVETVTADITERRSLKGLFNGAQYCFHLAAKFGFWPRDANLFYRVNVEGSRHVISAAAEAGVRRICYTSSVATLGLWRTKAGEASSETQYAEIAQLHGLYKQSKYVAEHEVLRLAAEGAPVVLVQPTMPHGPYDHRPTPSGKLVLDYLRGKMPGYVDTAMNVAHVDDLALGHLLAVERGAQGRSYICGGENLKMSEILAVLSQLSGLPPSNRAFPAALPVLAARISELVEGGLLRREPRVAMEAAQMAGTAMIFSDERAREELGYSSRPAAAALYDSAKWFVAHGYVEPERVAKINWRPPTN